MGRKYNIKKHHGKTINIHGKEYTIKICKVDAKDDADIDYDTQIIRIDESITTKEAFYQALLHECGHGLANRIGLIQIGFTHEMDEMYTENNATFLTENFNITLK